MRWKWTLVAVLVAFESPAWAQLQSRPADPPLVTAANESWYLLREPVQFAGDLYYPAGPAVFFNGNTMVRSGHYNGVPLYTDTTVEPFSILLVPITRGLLQPYTRPRPAAPAILMAAVAPTAPPLSPGAISVYTPDTLRTVGAGPVGAGAQAVAVRAVSPPLTDVVGTTGFTAPLRQTTVPVVSMRRPESNDGVWIMFGGEKWVSAGAAMSLDAADVVRVGEYAGFPVFARRDFTQEVIYLPSRAGLMAPYRLKE
jgi:hypothetical protein